MPRILVVDDDEQIRSLLRLMLERAGYEVEEAPDGDEAVRLYRQRPSDVVITDILMPGKEGIETIMELRRDFPDVKIIAISGGGRVNPSSYLEWARKFGVEHTFAKPVDRDDLLDAIRELLEGTDAALDPAPRDN